MASWDGGRREAAAAGARLLGAVACYRLQVPPDQLPRLFTFFLRSPLHQDVGFRRTNFLEPQTSVQAKRVILVECAQTDRNTPLGSLLLEALKERVPIPRP